MSFLILILSIKIAITVLGLCVALLFLSKQRVDALFGFGDASVTLYRLYGVAMLALTTAYTGGLLQAISGHFPVEVVSMGLVSNLGAAVTMFMTGYARRKPYGAAVFAFIGMTFAASLVLPESAMRVW